MTRNPFPDAPDGSYICEEGWLVVDDEAWTEDEWRARNQGTRPSYWEVREPRRGHRYKTEAERIEARRRSRREYNRRIRGNAA